MHRLLWTLDRIVFWRILLPAAEWHLNIPSLRNFKERLAGINHPGPASSLQSTAEQHLSPQTHQLKLNTIGTVRAPSSSIPPFTSITSTMKTFTTWIRAKALRHPSALNSRLLWPECLSFHLNPPEAEHFVRIQRKVIMTSHSGSGLRFQSAKSSPC